MGYIKDDLLLSIANCSKSFYGVQALFDIDLNIHKGEVHCIVGENGAGKSTLIKILSGALQPNTGTIEFLGNSYKSFTPGLALALGIQTIYQEIELIPYLTVAENIFLGQEAALIDYKRIKQRSKELIDSIGVEIDPLELIVNLPIAQKQTVQILKALAREAKIIIMDEPTASFSKNEVSHLLNLVRLIAKRDIGIIYISHHLEEVFEIHDSITVLRDGKKIAYHTKNEVGPDQLICEMVGRSADMFFARERVPINREKCVEFNHFSQGNKVKDVSFKIHKGEVLGIAGMVGAGRTELVRLIFGADKKDTGEVIIEGKPIKIKSPRQSVEAGIGLLTEDRQRSGVILDHDVAANISVVNMDKERGIFVNYKKQKNDVQRYIQQINIKTPSIHQTTKNLSGGNQQKVVLAKWMYANSNIIIFDEPTRGIDVGAKEEIYKLIVEMARNGKYILVISSDLPELISLSDRVLVMKHGQIVGEFSGDEIAEENIVACSTGGKL